MIKQINPVIEKYKVNYEFDNLDSLFVSYQPSNKCLQCPSGFLWLRLPVGTNRNCNFIYVCPTDEFKECLTNIYGEPCDANIYLEIFKQNNGRLILKMNYQHIIGGKFLCEITPEQFEKIANWK